MTRIARTAIAVAASLTAIIALPTVASAEGRTARPPVVRLQKRPLRIKVLVQDSVSYRRSVEIGLAQSHQRIMNSLRRHPLRQATYYQILNDLTEGRRLIRARVATATLDGKVTAWERQQVNLLVNAIATDLTNTYGPLDCWRLL